MNLRTAAFFLFSAAFLTAGFTTQNPSPEPAPGRETPERAVRKQPEFSARLILTRGVNLSDQFRGILPNRPPAVSTVSRVAQGEKFHARILFSGALFKGGSDSFTANITMTGPQGKKTEIPLKASFRNIQANTAGFFLLPQSVNVFYRDKDPKGKYTFELELTDLNAGKTVKASASVEYLERITPDPGVRALAKLETYYQSPCPEYILPAFREFLTNLPDQKAKEKNRFNPLPQLALFYFLLKENPQCVPAFTELYNTLRNEEKLLAGIILKFVLKDADSVLTKQQFDVIAKKFPVNPFLFERVTVPWQLDVCWAEFLVRGTRAPVMKTIYALSLASDAMPLQKYKEIAAPTREDQRKLRNGLTVMAARWSMASLAKKHPLIRFYVEAALLRKEIQDPVAAALAAKAIGMKVKMKETPKKPGVPRAASGRLHFMDETIFLH